MSDGPRILIVDDEPNIRDLLTTSLRFAGFAVRAVGNGAQTISAVLEEEPDLIILDVMLPDMNGFGVTKRLRTAGYTAPILFLTAKDDTEDKITGLTVGGDDYVTKPFSLDEIVARIKAILRRTMHAEEDAVIRTGELTMDQDTHEVLVGDVPVELSPTEFKLLRYLMLNPEPGALEGADPRPRVGVRLQWRRGHRRELHLVPAAQARPALHRAADPDQAGIRVHAEVLQALTQARRLDSARHEHDLRAVEPHLPAHQDHGRHRAHADARTARLGHRHGGDVAFLRRRSDG